MIYDKCFTIIPRIILLLNYKVIINHIARMGKLCLSVIKTSTNDRYRFMINWYIISSINVLVGITYFIETSILHQFITTSADQTPNTKNIEPGLGLTELWYSAIITAGGVGVITGAFLYGFIECTGGLLFAFSSNQWLILLSKLLNGLFIGFHQSLMRNYAVETCDNYINTLTVDKRKISTIKHTVLFIFFICTVGGMAIGPGVTVIGTQIVESKFHWPGYYISLHSFMQLLVVLLMFSDKWTDIVRVKSITRLADFYKRPVIPHYMLVLFVYFYIVLGWNISIVETLQNIILSDQFGLTIENTSYILIGILAIYLTSITITYILQKFKFDNRNILIGNLIIGIIGTLIMTDWQSIGGDPCNQFNDDEIISITDYNTTELSYYCEQFSNDTNNCFWNPISRITGDHCDRCRPVCLSENHSLNFIQLFIGTILLSSCYAPGRLLVTTIASDLAENRSQGWLMGVLVASAALSRGLGAILSEDISVSHFVLATRHFIKRNNFIHVKHDHINTNYKLIVVCFQFCIFYIASFNVGNYTYRLAGNRTWLTMLITFIVHVIAVSMIIVMYRKMKKPNIIEENSEQTIDLLEATDEISSSHNTTIL